MNFKVLSVLKKFMSEEQYEAFKEKSLEFETELNSDITKYVDANTPKMEDLVVKAKTTAHAEIIKEFGIDGVETVEQLNKHIETVKLATTDEGKALSKLQLDFDTIDGKYKAEVDLRTKLEKETTHTNQMNKIKAFVGDDEKKAKYIHWDLTQQITEELPFDDVFKKYEEDNKQDVKKHIDPRFTRQAITNTGNEDFLESYKRQKEEGKI